MTAILFVDARVPGSATLTEDLAPGTHVVPVPGNCDALALISDILRVRPGANGLHILCHGAAGTLFLGDAPIDSARLTRGPEALAAIGNALDEDAGILLYACDVAANAAGLHFLKQLSKLTGHPVAASTTRVGNSALGGNWTLDARTKPFTVEPIISEKARKAYPHVLPAPNPLVLASLDGTTGFRMDAAVLREYAGKVVSAAGDINGDGFDDLIIGSPYVRLDGAPYGGPPEGSAYIVFGKSNGFDAVLALSTLDGAIGFRAVNGAGGGFGRSVSNAGDINGDGVQDFVIGAPLSRLDGSGKAGSSYVVFGRAEGFDALLNVTLLDGTNGFRLDGASDAETSGSSVSAAGDVNGDGFDDLIVGAPRADPDGMDAAGSSYVVFGKASGFDASLALSTLNGSNGFRIDGQKTSDFSGLPVAGAGDINGDGFDDLLVHAYGSSTPAVYVVLGKSSGFDPTVALSNLDGSDGFRIIGAQNPVSSAKAAGDINGDGIDDFVIGDPSPLFFDTGIRTGSAFVVFGRRDAFSATFDLASLDGANGFRLDGIAVDDVAGHSLSSAGDVNGDGIDDILIGAPRADPNGVSNAGSSYVVFGRSDGFAPAIALSSLDGTNGFRIDGSTEDDQFGYSVSAAGDVNGDGFDDILIGAWQADPNGVTNAGSIYLIFGGNFTGAVAYVGTDGDDILTGTAASERFLAGLGNDTVVGGEGDDHLDGGEGDDHLDGGMGNDTYVVDSAGDVIVDEAGNDTVQSAVNFVLPDFLENVILTGTAHNSATGNATANVLVGNSGNNPLRGNGGNDQLHGAEGYDTALFTGASAQYAFVSYLGAIHVADRISGRDGVDDIFDIEQAFFDADNVTAVFTASDVFTPLEYIASYTDLMGGFGANAQLGYEHFASTGRFDLRTASFDGLEYLASQPDLLAGLGLDADAAATHYIQSSRFEGRTVSFNGLEYLASYTDLVNSFGVNEDLGTMHYLTAGRNEGRTVTFRGLEYLASNPDLMAGYGDNFELATIHYIASGRFEGRVSSFHALEYIASYADLIQGIGANINAGALHYINSGRFEGRTEHFDAAQYLANYADLAAGFGGSHELAAIHYIQSGFSEGRSDQPVL